MIEQSPTAGSALLENGDWIADSLWLLWSDDLTAVDMEREQLRRILVDYRNEMRLWVVGERRWEHAIAGLIGRINRRAESTSVIRSEAREIQHV
jgi:hypothetical protein